VRENEIRESICAFGKSLFDRGLTAGSTGNLSVRLDDAWLLTPTNACLGALDPVRLSELDWNGNLISGDPGSKEAFLHRAMYQERAGAGAIVHLHSTRSVVSPRFERARLHSVAHPVFRDEDRAAAAHCLSSARRHEAHAIRGSQNTAPCSLPTTAW
jgi:hypothetical protein